MRTVGAEEFYFFDRGYYEGLKRKLGKNVFLGVVSKDETVISAAIFFTYGHYGHYHLSGSLPEFMGLYPNNLLIYNTSLYLKEKGIRFFHLGGGTTRSEDNGLYKFKKRFSNTKCDFYIGKVIFDQSAYQELTGAWEKKFPQKREAYKNILLKYRY
jgi:lipid II:glycine glycyltransferase (peptidoglycan interpeptide bridge formation enzyme)